MNASSDPALVKIDATAAKKFAPDKIELNISFSDELKKKEECVAQFNKDMVTVLAALESVGIDRKRVKQSGFKVYPKRETAYRKIEENGEEDYYRAFEYINGYAYEGESSVSLEANPDTFGEAWLALLKTDGMFTFEFEYGLKDEAKAEAELLKEVVTQAKARASVLAEAGGAALGRVHEMSHSFHNAVMSYDCSDLYMMCAEAGYGSAPDFMTPDFNPEEISVRCSVSCSWELV